MTNLTIGNYYSSLINPSKYVGKKKIITIRSSYELLFVKMMDANTDIKEWSSEDYTVFYKLNGKIRKYYIDFYYQTNNGKKYLVEVKPANCLVKPSFKGNMKTYKYQVCTFILNSLKWESAKKFCIINNMEFKIVTEKELGIK